MGPDVQNVLTDQSNALNPDTWLSNLLSLPASQFGAFGGGGDASAWITRFFQFGALGSLLQFLGIAGLIRWVFDSLHEYITSRFVLDVFLSGDEIPCL
jgi:hypothetical protein